MTASATDRTVQALGLGLGPDRLPSAQADAHVDAGVAQVERVGVALAAVADDGDLAPLDHGQVGIVVVEHLGHGGHSFVCVLLGVVQGGCRGLGGGRPGGRRGQAAQRPVGDRAGAAADGDHARLHELLDAEGLQHLEQRLELVARCRSPR